MIQNYRILLALIAGLAFAGNVSAADVAKVNGASIPQNRLDTFVQSVTSHGQQQDTPELRNQIKELLITNEVITQEAVKKGLDKDPDVAARLDITREDILKSAFAQDYVKNNPVSDADAQKEYDNIKLLNAGKSQYDLSHILVKTQAEAQSIIAKLKKGAKFEDLAKKSSIDPSGKQGGELGWHTLDNFVPEFADAAGKLKKGQITTAPVQSQFGWHVIRLNDTKPVEVPSFDEIKPQIVRMVQQRNLEQYVKDLRDKAKVE